MDRPDSDPEILREDLKNLRTINRLFGGLAAVKAAVNGLLRGTDVQSTMEILDLATGSGDQPVALAQLFRRLGRKTAITGVDRNPVMLAEARQQAIKYPEIVLLQSDITNLPFPDQSYDIVLCSLALHHFSLEDAVKIVAAMKRIARVGIVVNELSRSSVGACAAWLYTHLTTRNPMTLYDSYYSVLRAFTRTELARIAREARVEHFTIRSRPMFRLILVSDHREAGR